MCKLKAKTTPSNVKTTTPEWDYVTKDTKANVIFYWDELEQTTWDYLNQMLGQGFVDPEDERAREITVDDVKYFTELVTEYLAEHKDVEFPVVDGCF